MTKIFILFFCSLLVLPLALGIGVSPARYDVDFAPGLTKNFDFSVRNNAGFPLVASVSVNGGMAKYVTLSQSEIPLKDNGVGTFTATLHLPQSYDIPGKNTIRLTVVEELPEGVGMIARTAVVPWIVVDVPYPGRYAEIGRYLVAQGAGGVNEGEETPVLFDIRNRGKEDLIDTRATFRIFDSVSNVLEEVEFPNLDIPAGQTLTTTTTINTTSWPPSDYIANITYYYDDIVLERDANFVIGTFAVDIIDYMKEVPKDGIVPFKMKARNLWKGEAYAEAILSVPGAEDAKTSREWLNDFARQDMTAFLDTTNLELGTHTGTIKLLYAKATTPDKKSGAEIPITFELVKPVEPETEFVLPAWLSSPVFYVAVGLVVLLAVNIFILLRLAKKKHKKEKV